MLTSNAEKCQGRRDSMAQATPEWLTDQDREKIGEMYHTMKSLNKIKGGDKFHVDHVVPLTHPLACGLHVPWNMQLLTEKDNKQKGNEIHTEPLRGSITPDSLSGSLRYRGRFVKGYSGNKSGVSTYKKALQTETDEAYDTFMAGLRAQGLGTDEMIIQGGHWMIENARSRDEWVRNVDKFGPFFKSKLGLADADSNKDNKFVLEIRHIDD